MHHPHVAHLRILDADLEIPARSRVVSKCCQRVIGCAQCVHQWKEYGVPFVSKVVSKQITDYFTNHGIKSLKACT